MYGNSENVNIYQFAHEEHIVTIMMERAPTYSDMTKDTTLYFISKQNSISNKFDHKSKKTKIGFPTL